MMLILIPEININTFGHTELEFIRKIGVDEDVDVLTNKKSQKQFQKKNLKFD